MRRGRPDATAAWAAVVFAATTAAVAYIGYLAIFTVFELYDDEGFFLLALRSYASGQALYDKVVLQYGPFYFEIFRLVGALGVPFDLDHGRVMTLVVWVAMTLVIGISTYAFTRSLFLGAGAQLVAFAVSLPLASDPMHPTVLLMLMIAGIQAIAFMNSGGRSYPWRFAAIGALVAACVLTKVNVGGFAVIAVAFACVLTIPSLARNPIVRLIAAAVLIAVPAVLMHSLLDQSWARRYAGEVALGAAAVVIATSGSRPEGEGRLAAVWWLLGGGAGLTIVVAGVALLTGSTLPALIRGVFLYPLQQTQAFLAPLNLPSATVYLAIASVAAAVVWTLYPMLTSTREPALEGAARLLVGVSIWISLIGAWTVSFAPRVDVLGPVTPLPVLLAWVAVAPRSTSGGWAHVDFARALLAAMTVVQGLQAYPVPGSQLASGAIPAAALAAVCINDGLAQLNLVPRLRRLAPAGLFLVLAAAWIPVTWRDERNLYDTNVPLGLPGATLVRLPADQATTLNEVTRFVRADCDTYIAFVGFESFYFFADVPPPTPPTRWIWLINDVGDEQSVVDRVEGIRRLCVIENSLVTPVKASGPLDNFVTTEFVTGETDGSYTILVRASGS